MSSRLDIRALSNSTADSRRRPYCFFIWATGDRRADHRWQFELGQKRIRIRIPRVLMSLWQALWQALWQVIWQVVWRPIWRRI